MWWPRCNDKYNTAIVLSYFLFEGIAGSVLYYGTLPYLVYVLGVSLVDLQRAYAAAWLPWSLKPLWGLLADRVPIWGYHSKNYVIAAACLFGPMMIGVPLSSEFRVITVFIVIVSTCMSIVNTGFDGQNAIRISTKQSPRSLAPKTKALIMIGAIVGTIVVGAFADTKEDAHRVRYAYGLCVPLAIPLIVYMIRHPDAIFFGDRSEARSSDLREHLTTNDEEIKLPSRSKPSSEEIVLVVVMAVVSCTMLLVLLSTTTDQVAAPFYVSAIMCGLVLAYVTRVYRGSKLAGLCVMAFLNEFLYGDVSAAQDLFYTAPDECVADGPGFGLLFYFSWTKFFAHTISICLMVLYMKWGVNWSCRTSFHIGTTIRISSSLTDVIIAKRWNLAAGITDKSMYMFGDAMINMPSSMWNQLAIILESTKVIKRGKEITTISIITGLQFMGQTLSRIAGMYLISVYNIKADLQTGNCNFDQYPALLVAAHVVAPIFLYPAAYAFLGIQT